MLPLVSRLHGHQVGITAPVNKNAVELDWGGYSLCEDQSEIRVSRYGGWTLLTINTTSGYTNPPSTKLKYSLSTA